MGQIAYLPQHTHRQTIQQHDAQAQLLKQTILKLTECETQHAILQQQLQQTQETVLHQKNQLQSLQDENIQFIREKAHLEGQLQQLDALSTT